MRVICLVPSLTETLIECGVNVVGRTRYCIHPAAQVANIASVGGTKGVDWQKCRDLTPDLVIFDREENLRQMADDCPFSWHATHITSVGNIGAELLKLSLKLENSSLSNQAEAWQNLAQKSSLTEINWQQIPGQIEALGNNRDNYRRVEYIIWRQPWMAVGRQTFIGSMLEKLGFAAHLNSHEKPYPELSQTEMSDPETFYLFSSEPYPFTQHRQRLLDAGINGAIVDGELYSWFGIRSYLALSQYL